MATVKCGQDYIIAFIFCFILGSFTVLCGSTLDETATKEKAMLFQMRLLQNVNKNTKENQNKQTNRGKPHNLLKFPSGPPTGKHPVANIIAAKNAIAKSTLIYQSHKIRTHGDQNMTYIPGSPAPAFSLPTLAGTLSFPGPIINKTTPILFYSHDPRSAFSICLWNCSHSVEDLLLNSPNNTHYIFLTYSGDGESTAGWMKEKLVVELENLVESDR